MTEGQLPSVEHRARKGFQNGDNALIFDGRKITFGAVGGIADDRMMSFGEMDADLVCPARFQGNLQKRKSHKGFGRLPMRHRAPPELRSAREFLAVNRVTSDGEIDGASPLLEGAEH